MKVDTIIFCDTNNQELDSDYAEKLICEMRKQMDWKIEPETRIHNELLEFSKGYSKIKRDVTEVAIIFRISHGLM